MAQAKIWDGTKWDSFFKGESLNDYAKLAENNTFTALNTFRANIAVSNGTAAGSQGQIILGNKPQSATVQANIISSTTGALNYIATENTGHYFRIGNNTAATSITTNDSETAILSHNAFEFARITNVGVAKWLGNANTATTANNAKAMAIKENIPVDSDLNNYKVPGEYAINDSATAATLINSPSVFAGQLTVTPFFMQIYQEYAGYSSSNIYGRRYIRGWYTSNSSIFWGPWQQFAYKSKTIAGYGITDAYTKTEVNNLISSTSAPAYTYSTVDLVAGSSKLTTGTLYIVYE